MASDFGQDIRPQVDLKLSTSSGGFASRVTGGPRKTQQKFTGIMRHAIVCLCFVGSIAATAEISGSILIKPLIYNGDPPSGFASIRVDHYFGLGTTAPGLFADVFLTSADIGSTIYKDASDVRFAEFAAELTNGIDGLNWVSISSYNSAGQIRSFGSFLTLESLALAPVGEPDFVNYEITRIGLRVNDLTDAANGLDIDLVYEGNRLNNPNVPEPGTWLMWSVGVCCVTASTLCQLRRRKRATLGGQE